MARTLLYTFCHHLAITAYDAMMSAEVRHIFIAGSFCSHPLVQKIVLSEFEYRKWIMAAMVHGRVSTILSIAYTLAQLISCPITNHSIAVLLL